MRVIPFHRRATRPLSVQQGSVSVRDGIGEGVVMDQMGASSCVKREMDSSSGMTAAK